MHTGSTKGVFFLTLYVKFVLSFDYQNLAKFSLVTLFN